MLSMLCSPHILPGRTGSPHLPLLVLGDQIAVKVLQSHFGHRDPFLGVVAHGGTGRLTRHRHGYLKGYDRQNVA